MDVASLFRMLGGLAMVLGLLAGALWMVRRFDIRLPGRVAGGTGRRLDLIERLPLDARRSVALIRRDGREHMILLAPEGALIVETDIIRDGRDAVAEAERARRAEAEAEAMRERIATAQESFQSLVDQVGARVRRSRRAVQHKLSPAALAEGSNA